MRLLFSNDTPGAFPPSYYAATADPPALAPALDHDTKAEVCVIGGGYTGLSTALHLAQKGLDVVLLEAHRVGFGASGRNGGQLGTGFNLDQMALEKAVGKSDARHLWALAEEAKALTRSLIDTHAPDSGLKNGVAHAQEQTRGMFAEHAYADFLAEHYGYGDIEKLDGAEMRSVVNSARYKGGAIDWGAGHIHPLRYAFGLARAAAAAGVRIHENTCVTGITQGARPVVRAENGSVAAHQVVLACNGYLGGLNGHVARRVMPINNFVVATEPLGAAAKQVLSKDIAVADSKFVVNYFRLSEDKRLIFGGGESYGYTYPKDIAAKVRKPLTRVFPQLAGVKIDFAWGGTLAVTTNRMPYIARPSRNIYSASGYSGHGVALTGLAGKIIAEAIAGETERFDLFSRVPCRRFPGGPTLAHPLLVLAMSWFSLRDRLGI